MAAGLTFIALGTSWFLTLVLSLYLDLRRHNLVQLGQLPRSTPALFSFTVGSGLSAGLANLEYVFSRDFARSPDAATRFWVPYLRAGYILSAAMLVLMIMLFWTGNVPSKS